MNNQLTDQEVQEAAVFDLDRAEETTDQKCPNKCGQLLVKWTEQDGPDDYKTVYYCGSCEERFDE